MSILRDSASFGQEPLPYPNFHVTNPPEHTRVRKLVARAFTPRSIKQQDDKIAGWIEALVDELVEAGSVDFVPDFAQRLSATVITDLLGVPVKDAHLWYRWMEEIHTLRGYINFLQPEKDAKAQSVAAAAAAEIANYFAELIASRKGTSDDSLVNGLLEAGDANDQLDRDPRHHNKRGSISSAGICAVGYICKAGLFGRRSRSSDDCGRGIYATVREDLQRCAGG